MCGKKIRILIIGCNLASRRDKVGLSASAGHRIAMVFSRQLYGTARPCIRFPEWWMSAGKRERRICRRLVSVLFPGALFRRGRSFAPHRPWRKPLLRTSVNWGGRSFKYPIRSDSFPMFDDAVGTAGAGNDERSHPKYQSKQAS